MKRRAGATTVAIVDDDPNTREVFRTILEHDGYRVIEATDGPSAVSLVRTELPDVVLLDLGLPGMSGAAVVEELRSDPATARVAIIAVTAMRPHLKSTFTRFAHWTSRMTGRPRAFLIAVAVILAWGITGPLFRFSDTWQLVINTGTTIVTFLMVFLIQNTQNRDAEATQLKLDELIRALEGAHNGLLDLEELGDDELDVMRADYQKLAEEARGELIRRQIDESAASP